MLIAVVCERWRDYCRSDQNQLTGELVLWSKMSLCRRWTQDGFSRKQNRALTYFTLHLKVFLRGNISVFLWHKYNMALTWRARTEREQWRGPTQKWKKITQTHTVWFLKQVVTSSQTGNLSLYRKRGTKTYLCNYKHRCSETESASCLNKYNQQ